MPQALNIEIGGIKCDNPECDFINKSVKVEDYHKWLNRKCPKCGSILLTQEDYDNTQNLFRIQAALNSMFNATGDMPMTSGTMNMNGTGNIRITPNDTIEKIINLNPETLSMIAESLEQLNNTENRGEKK